MKKGHLSDRLSNLGVLCVLCANPFLAGESTRAKLAKLAKDAKTRSTKRNEFTRAEKEHALYPPSSQDATPPATSVVAGLTEPGNPSANKSRAPRRSLRLQDSLCTVNHQPKPNKTDACNGSKAVCRVFKVHPSPSPNPRR